MLEYCEENEKSQLLRFWRFCYSKSFVDSKSVSPSHKPYAQKRNRYLTTIYSRTQNASLSVDLLAR
jgi:hypothetical protein